MCPCPFEAFAIYGNLSSNDKSFFQRSEMTFQTSGRTFSTFKDCWTERLVSSGQYDAEMTDYVDSYIQTMDEFEAEFSCSGVCQPALFWFTQPVTISRPTEPCILDMMNEVEYADDSEIETAKNLLTKLQWGGSGSNQWGQAASAFEAAGGGSGSAGGSGNQIQQA